MTSPHRRYRLRIDRLELDLRGITPAAAEAAARALGPALAKALAEQGQVAPAGGVDGGRIDGGRIASAASPAPSALAAGIAAQVARSLFRGGR